MRLPFRSKAILLACLSAAIIPNTTAPAHARRYPGAFWTQTGRDMSGVDGSYTQGFVRQGVELARPKGLPVQVYGRYNWRLRNIYQDYYNAYTPYAGAMISSKHLDAGVELGWPHYTGIPNGNQDHNLFLSWFRYWSLKEWRRTDFVKAIQLSTWGNGAYDMANNNGSSIMGWVKLEADPIWLLPNWVAGPFVSYDWRFRNHNPQYFDYSAPSLGAEIGNGVAAFGVKYSWRDYPKLNRNVGGFEVFLTIYEPWALQDKSEK